MAELPELRILPTDEVPRAAAERIAETLAAAIADRGVAHWATTGGSAAPGLYQALGRSPLRERVAWERVHTWWGDDRFVPYDHPESNVRPLEAILLGGAGGDTGLSGQAIETGPEASYGVIIPTDQLHRWPIPQALADATGPAGAAAGYAETMRALLPRDDAGSPVLDLVVLGVGPDGHVLSVFPGSPAWDAAEVCVAVPAPTHVEPHIERVTMHPRVIGAARAVLVLSTGASKAPALGRAWTGDDPRELPARAARVGTATWILDEAAAAELPRG